MPRPRFAAATIAVLALAPAGCVPPASTGGPARPAAEEAISERRVVTAPGVSPVVAAYSPAIRAGDFVFVSGLIGVRPGTQELAPGGIEAETRQTLENVRTLLAAAGATMRDVVECTVFLVDMADFAGMNRAYLEFFPEEPPARATVAVTALPRAEARVEIKCSAYVGRRVF